MAEIIYRSHEEKPISRASTILRTALPWAVPVLVVTGWELAAQFGWLDVRYFSSPGRVLESMWAQIQDGTLTGDLSISISRIVIGFLLGALPGLAMGLAIGVSPLIRRLLAPTMNALYPLPKIAMIPLFLMIFGLTENAKYAVIAMGVFFPVLINTVSGVANIDKIYLDVADNYGARGFQYYRTIAIPGALPFIFAGLRIAYGVSLLLIVAAEIIGTTSGIGYRIWNSWQVFRIEDLFIGLIIIALLGLLGNGLLRLLERWSMPWLK
jgi:NitT/TauT family transport system permease protein